jgi:hypothetical protein
MLSDYDGYSSNVWSISVGAVDSNDKGAVFGEKCSAMLVSTYGVTLVRELHFSFYSRF